MDKFEKLKTIIEKELNKKHLELENARKESMPKWLTDRKEGWEDCLDYLLSEISLMENNQKT
mgnify:FL=1